MKIKELRTACGMTQKAFAAYIGVGKRTLEGWENKDRGCPEYIRALIEYKVKNEGMMKNSQLN